MNGRVENKVVKVVKVIKGVKDIKDFNDFSDLSDIVLLFKKSCAVAQLF